MNILFLSVAINNLNGNGLYTDLLKSLRDQGNQVYVVCPIERRNKERSNLLVSDSITFLRVKIGNITKTNLLEKGITTLLIDMKFISAIKANFDDIKFDLVLYTTPPVTFAKVITFIKRRDNCKSYLILKDIFPQNAVDLDIIKKNGLIYRFFRNKEKKLYSISDYIGCTSQANIEYIKKHNCEVDPNTIEIFPNSIFPRSLSERSVDGNNIRKKYDIPENSVVFVYGGNIGRPQGIDFIKKIIDQSCGIENLFLIIIGSGTEYENIERFINIGKYINIKLMKSLSSDEYWEFLSCCDVGLVFLDRRFTVPNTPARLTYYMESALPILAATDKSTDIKEILEEANCGFWIESGNLDDFQKYQSILLTNSVLRKKLGENGRIYMEENFHINRNINILTKHFKTGDI